MQRMPAAAVAFCALGAAALARDGGQYFSVDPSIKQWIERLTDKNGMGCCSTADGFPAEAEWDVNRKGYRVFIKGRWYQVPESAVITQPNRIGHAMVWYVESGGVVRVRCFLPGAGA